ncbi:hypothetical protein [Streptomyces antibioticus]|uniref:hypothetical protein n=1 Tax=Streptomyces antibioticus TaxID=1890 RepID=UPI0036F805AA
MAEPTQDHTPPTIPATYAWCTWHGAFSNTCRLVGIIEQGSGSGGGQFACADCRTRHGLTPVADQP